MERMKASNAQLLGENPGKRGRAGAMRDIIGPVMMLTACMASFLDIASARSQMPYMTFGIIVFLIISTAGYIGGKRAGRTAVMIAAVLLAVALIIARVQLMEGLQLLMNKLFEMSEKTQAYVYEKYAIGEGVDEMTAMDIAVAWLSCALVIPMAVSGSEIKRFCMAAFALTAVLFAYFGLIPSLIPVLMLAAALIAVGTEGEFRALIPFMLVAALVFGAVIAAHPGENKTVSRFDETLRDKLAFSTVAIEGQQAEQEQTENVQGGGGAFSEFLEKTREPEQKRIWVIAGLILLILVILFIPAVIHDRLEKRRKINRAGMDSPYHSEAISAMFPYAMKWLNECGFDLEKMPFGEYDRLLAGRTSEVYREHLRSMLSVWKEAYYSEHEMTYADVRAMRGFVNETIEMTKQKVGRKGRMRIRLRTAL